MYSLASKTSSKTLSEILFSGTLKPTILRSGLKTHAACKIEPFYSNTYLFETVNCCIEYFH